MKKQILAAIFLCLIFVSFAIGSFYFNKKQKEKTYKILEVVEADSFIIDINNNNKIDDNELFKVKNIIAFSPIKNSKSIYWADELGLDTETYLKVGYLARLFAKNKFTNEFVTIVSPFDKTKNEIDIQYKKKSVAEILLKNGLAFAVKNPDNPKYYQFQNIKQIKANAKEISVLNYSLVNSKTNFAHKINSKHSFQIKNGELFLENQLKYLNSKVCDFCFKNNPHKKEQPIHKTVKSLYKVFDDVELFLISPLEFKKPNTVCNTEICKKLIKQINSSQKSIDIALYGINEQNEIIDALKSAKQHGVKIRAVADNSENIENVYPDTIKFAKEFNAKYNSSNTLMHNKFIIFDDKYIFMGSINLSPAGTSGYNANIAVIIKSENLAKNYRQEFNQMYDGKFSTHKKHFAKINANTPKTAFEIYFSPKDDVLHNGILPKIQKAQKKIYLSSFYLTDRELVDNLIKAKNRNVEVIVILDALSSMKFKDRIINLRNANIPVKVENWGGKNHEKTIMIDDEYLILGSCNFTKSGFYKNDENTLIIKNEDIAKFYADYFLNLFNSIDNKYLNSFPRAEGFESINSCYDGIDNNFDGKIDFEDDACRKKLLKKG